MSGLQFISLLVYPNLNLKKKKEKKRRENLETRDIRVTEKIMKS